MYKRQPEDDAFWTEENGEAIHEDREKFCRALRGLARTVARGALPAIEELNLFYCCFAERPTPSEVASAFSYFTYVASGRLLVVCDIQGVGNFFTDPQIHSVDGAGFGVGNRGVDGIMRFLASHKHSALCEDLGLPAPSLELENRHDGWDIQ